MSDAASLPDGFAHLEPFVGDWALATMARRHARRISSSEEDRRAFYDGMAPSMPAVVEHLDRYRLDDMPADVQRLMQISLSLIDVAMSIEAYGLKFEADHAKSSRLLTVVREFDGL